MSEPSIERRYTGGAWKTVERAEGGGGPVTAGDIDSEAAADGEVLTADGAGGAAWEPGGGTPPTNRGQFTSPGNTAIANGGVAFLGWEDNSGFDDQNVVDLTDPTAPAVLTDGVYAVHARVEGAAMTANGYFAAQLYVDTNGEGIILSQESRLATAAQATVETEVSGTWWIPTGGLIQVRVVNRDGAAERNFNFEVATIQRIS